MTAAKSRSSARRSGGVYILAGQWRRTRLQVLDAPGIRPTPNRVRETLFNWLGQTLHGWHCLDVFAGSGALGYEAASRGAAHVTMCEVNPSQYRQLLGVRNRLRAESVSILCQDGLAVLASTPRQSMDLVFLDPPFSGQLFEPALSAASRVLKPAGMIYLEAPIEWPPEQLEQLRLGRWRHITAGAVNAHLLVHLD